MMTTTRDTGAGVPASFAPAQAHTLTRTLRLSWPRLALGAVLTVAALLNFWALGSVGYSNTYYAAAVKSMLQSWHNFFFVSFDPGGFVSIDKPPLGFWIETASAKLFGYSGVSMLLPEALAGVLSVAVLYRLVARVWGRGAGLLAALFLALTPVSIITSRNITIDSLLVLTVLLAAWAVARAGETGRLRWLLLCAGLVGLGFNIKMLEAYLVVPAFGLVYLVGARIGWRRRISHLALATIVLLGVSLSWATAVDLTPAAARPYVGSSGTNSELNLALGYNGLQRLTGQLFGHAGTRASGGTTHTASGTPRAAQTTSESSAPGAGSGTGGASGSNGAGGPNGPGGGLFNGGPAGLFRLLGTTLGGQVSWLLLLAVLGLAIAALRVPWRRLDERGRSLVLWGTWLLTAGTFFSVAQFFHPYYTVMLAPAVAALAGIGVAALWREYRSGGWRAWLLPVALLATAAVQVYILRDYPDWSRWLTPLVVGACIAAALALVLARPRKRSRRMAGLALGAVGIAVASLLAAPTTWAAYSVTHTVNATIPTAGPSAQSNSAGGAGGPGAGGLNGGPGGPGGPGGLSGVAGPTGPGRGGGFGGPGGPAGPGSDAGAQGNTALIRYLEAHQDGATYLVATASSMSASSIIIATGKPVMALGGFSGNDQILTTAQLARLVANGAVRYFLIQSGGPGAGGAPPQGMPARLPAALRTRIARNGAPGGPGGPNGNSALTQWVTAHGTVVPASQYASSTNGFDQATTLYYVGGKAAVK